MVNSTVWNKNESAIGREFPQLMDLFSLPWAGLLATTVQYFDDTAIEFDPAILYQDIAVSTIVTW